MKFVCSTSTTLKAIGACVAIILLGCVVSVSFRTANVGNNDVSVHQCILERLLKMNLKEKWRLQKEWNNLSKINRTLGCHDVVDFSQPILLSFSEQIENRVGINNLKQTSDTSFEKGRNLRFRRNISPRPDCHNTRKLMTSGHPLLMLIQEGHDILLKCHTCSHSNTLEYDEKTMPTTNNLTWFVRKAADMNTYTTARESDFTEIRIDGEAYIGTPKGDLLVEEVKASQAAEYKCAINGILMSFYRVDVVEKEHRIQVVEESLEGIHPEPERVLQDNNLKVFTLWEPWSDCTRCNVRGEKRRIGHCMVKKMDTNKPVLPVDIPNLHHYYHGVPCRSTVLPKEIASLEEIKYRYSETLIAYCFLPCPTVEAIKTVTDHLGNVVEVVETGKGFLSMKEEKPTFPPLVKRETIYQEVGKSLIMSCPLDDSRNQPLRWQNGSQMITFLSATEKHLGRVFIDIANRLVIDSTEFHDTAAYSCWLRERHVATIKVRIVPSFGISHITDKITLIGVIITMLMIGFIGVAIFRQQRSDNKRYY